MIRLWHKFQQWRCWMRGGKSEAHCKFFIKYKRFANGACENCKYNPKNREVAE